MRATRLVIILLAFLPSLFIIKADETELTEMRLVSDSLIYMIQSNVDCDGQKKGYDLELTRAVSESVGIPVIASGGAGELKHFYDAFTVGKADAVLAASLFHFNEIPIESLKKYLKEKNIPVRPV
mgnify:CR=1 FL=1